MAVSRIFTFAMRFDRPDDIVHRDEVPFLLHDQFHSRHREAPKGRSEMALSFLNSFSRFPWDW
jgi:hypothetical protein|tara:strand:- start:1357 stop:1545 length:189 start_codon:yes stop_codon:yes gene_type:complete